jgi:predicted Zn finger-like uncharacterized protein
MPSLAARCTACGTVFRVVQDQLRIAGGLVRCGRCGEVFNAVQGLIDLDTSEPATLTPAPDPQPIEVAAEHTPATSSQRPDDTAAPLAQDDEAPPAPALEFAAIDPAPARIAVDEVLLHGNVAAAVDSQAQVGTSEADPRAEPDDMPSFVRQADRAQRWHRPRVRAVLAAVAALGTVTLLAQAVHSYRDPIAARIPAVQPMLEAGCSVLGCRVEAARAIDKLAVESSGLVRVEKSGVYKLQVTLRNRGSTALALPALDLTLSDGAGKPLARRVLHAADLGVNTGTLAAGRELALQATLQAATEPIVGYTIELFYP